MKELSVKFNKSLELKDFDFEREFEKAKKGFEEISIPNFATYSPDIDRIREIRDKYQGKSKIIVEGNGGSISSFRGIFECLKNQIDKDVYILDTDDPDFVSYIKKQCPKEETLLIVISKSGGSIQSIADYIFLQDYDAVFVTSETGALNELAKKRSIDVIKHPEISGRFSGNTESALFALEMILPNATEELLKGAKMAYNSFSPISSTEENLALKTAVYLDSLEKIGYNEVFLSIYSKQLSGFFELIIQLFHESVCKEEKGQTFYGGEAPENQHHTLQRFNSGRKNSIGSFVTVKNFKERELLSVGEDIKDIQVRNIKLEDLSNFSLENIIDVEFKGTWLDTEENNVPAFNLELEETSLFHIGIFMAFWQYCAFYSALLRKVEPCTQPGVEKSKEYMFRYIKNDI